MVTLLLTFGVSLMLRDLAQVVWGTETYSIAAPVTGVTFLAGVSGADLSPVRPRGRLRRDRADLVAGLPHADRRGAARDRGRSDMVASFGIPIRLVYGVTFFYGCALAGLAAVLLGPIYAVFPTMGHDFLVLAFAVVIVGGMGSILGAVVAALLLAQVQGSPACGSRRCGPRPWSTASCCWCWSCGPAGLFSRLGDA